MDDIIHLTGIELIPVVELFPSRFATHPRAWWEGVAVQGVEERHRYWLECLSDADLVGLEPVERGSWHVALPELSDSDTLAKILNAHMKEQGGLQGLETSEHIRPLEGGIALRCRSHELLIEPSCCTSLRDYEEWRAAARYRESEWAMLWIGHPWLSMKYLEPHLILSEPHESDDPVARWSVFPEELERETERLERELEEFANLLAAALKSGGISGDRERIGRELIGWMTD